MPKRADIVGRAWPVPVLFGLLLSVWGAGSALATHAVVHNPMAAEHAYSQTCVACHGPDGRGVMPGIPDLTRKDGPLSKPDEILLAHIIEGFSSGKAPISMPPKGGNPSLSKADIADILGYMRNRFEH